MARKVVLFCWVLFFPLVALASNGAKPIATNGLDGGRGGAGVAVGDSAHSIALNPAAIASIPGWLRVETSAGLRFGRTKFSNTFNSRRFGQDRGSFMPAFSLAFSLGLGTLSLSPKRSKENTKKPTKEEILPCENCGKPVLASASKCPHCGAEFEPISKPEDTFQCENCGKPVPASATKCPYCGAEFEPLYSPTHPQPSEPSYFLPPRLPDTLSRWKAGLSIFGVLGAGGKSAISSALFDATEDHSGLAVIAVAPTVAFRLNRYLSFGVSFHLYQVSLSDNDSISGSSGTSNGLVFDYSKNPPEPIGFPPISIGGAQLTYGELFSIAGTNDAVASAYADIDDASAIGFGGSIGMLFTPSPYISIGLSYTFESSIPDIKGKAHLDSSKSIESIQSDPQIQAFTGLLFQSLLPNGFTKGLVGNYDFAMADFKLPAILNVGLAIRPFDRLLIAMDFRWIRWSTAFKVFHVTLSNGDNEDINAVVGSNQIKSDSNMLWKDQIVFAIGVELTLLRSKNGSEFILQLGYNHGNSPSPAETLSPTSAPNIEDHVTAGFRMNLKNMGFSLSYIHGFTKKTYIQNNINLPEYSNTFQEANQDVLSFNFWKDF